MRLAGVMQKPRNKIAPATRLICASYKHPSLGENIVAQVGRKAKFPPSASASPVVGDAPYSAELFFCRAAFRGETGTTADSLREAGGLVRGFSRGRQGGEVLTP